MSEAPVVSFGREAGETDTYDFRLQRNMAFPATVRTFLYGRGPYGDDIRIANSLARPQETLGWSVLDVAPAAACERI